MTRRSHSFQASQDTRVVEKGKVWRRRWETAILVTLLLAGGALLLAGVPTSAVAMQAVTGTPAPVTATVAATKAVTATTAATSAVTGTTAAATMPTIPTPVAVQLDPKTTALLILDVTTTICQPRPSCVATLPGDAALLKKARDAGAFVAYSDTGGTTAVLPEVAPGAPDPEVSGRADKFFGTNLDDLLKGKQIKTVVIVGYVANGAVLYTTFGASVRGYTVVVPVDGTGAEDPFAAVMTNYQLLNEPGFANPTNQALIENRVTLSRSDLITFVAGAPGPKPAATTAPAGTPAATTTLAATVAVTVTRAATTPAAGTTPAATAAVTVTRAAATAVATQAAAAVPPAIPADHTGRPQCLICHATGLGGAPHVPSVPDHSKLKDDPTVCTGCHTMAK